MKGLFLKLVQFECAIIAAYHGLLGLAATVSPETAAQLAPLMYGVSLEAFAPMRPEYVVVIRFIGAFAITFGVVMAFAAWDPLKYRAVVAGAVLFFGIRIVDRLLSADVLASAFQATAAQNFRHILLMASFVIILGLFIVRPPLEKGAA